MLPKDLVVPSFTSCKDRRRVRGAVTDAAQLGKSYEHWLSRFTEFEAELTATGREVKRVPIDPDEFFAFCAMTKSRSTRARAIASSVQKRASATRVVSSSSMNHPPAAAASPGSVRTSGSACARST